MPDKACAGATWDGLPCDKAGFVDLVRDQGKALYRDLPWRNIDDPYAVLVSEVMLQQTQVARVLDFWPRFMARFPSIDALASAGTSDVLEAWQGLGYNRRALALKRACDRCSADHAGTLPSTCEELIALPGIGPATAAGVVAFAFNRPAVYIETNVRSVFLYHLFPEEEGVTDKRLAPYVRDTCPDEDARAWYYALLDYGSHLKATVGNPARRSAHYARQGRFEGSHREKRSLMLKCVLASEEGVAIEEVARLLDDHERAHGRSPLDPQIVRAIADELAGEGFFTVRDGILSQ